MIKVVFIFLLLFSSHNYAQEGFSPEELKALNNFQAKEYGQALNFYQNLLNVQLNSSQLSIVHYNIGTIYLAEGDYPNALKNLQQALQGAGGTNPLLIRNTELNLAVTRIKQISQFMKQKDFDPDLARDWIRSAQYDVQNAQSGACLEDAREGYPVCRPNSTAQKLNEMIKALKTRLPTNVHYQKMLPALAFLQSALYAWETKQPALADVFLQFASENAKNKNGMNFMTQNLSPENMLKQLIYHQRELQQIGMQIRSRIDLPTSFINSLTLTQDAFNQAARDFYPLVFRTQELRFHSPYNPDKIEDSRCQKIPWNSVLPEYQQGLNDADKAGAALNAERIQIAITNQETAAVAWEQALAYLINPPKQAPQPEQVQAEAKPNGPQPESMQKLLMNLQEMEMDATPQGQTKGIKLNQVERPW